MSLSFLQRTERPRLAYRFREGRGPATLFLPGYASDMAGAKAAHLDAWAARTGRPLLRFDYAGCGESEGRFEEQTLAGWRDDVLALIDASEGPLVLIGSSMGGWLMLLVALARPDRIKGMIGIAAAPDFTDWGYSQDEKLYILQHGRLERPSPYGAPLVITRSFWQSGEALRLLHGEIGVDCAVRLLHGQADREVPVQTALTLAQRLRSDDVQVTLVKGGDHRLSRESDLRLLEATAERLLESL